MLTKHTTVVHYHHNTDGYLVFSRFPDELRDEPTEIRMPVERFIELGSPLTITVTVQPGDLLNADLETVGFGPRHSTSEGIGSAR